MPDFAQLQVGAVVTPLATGTGNSLLRDADPALYFSLAFFEQVIKTHLGARWDAEVTALGMTDLVGKIVATTMSIDPAYYLVQEQATPPILALYRISSEYAERTRHKSHKVGTWGFDYIFPPLGAGHAELILAFRNAIESVLMDRVDRGYDPSYNSSERVFQTAGITSIKLTGPAQYVRLSPPSLNQTNATFEELHLRFEVREEVKPMPDTFPAMEGVSASISEGSFPDVAQFEVNNS